MQIIFTTISHRMQITHQILTPETRLVVFDLDGTLYTKTRMTWHMLANAPITDWRKMLAERKTRKLLRGQWLQNEESFYQIYFQNMANICKSTTTEICTWYNNLYMPLMVGVIRKHYKPTTWLLPFVEHCKKLGIRIVVLSDYGHVHEKLEALGIDEKIFDLVISAPELGGLKPAPQLMTQLLERMNVEPSQCIIIGDRDDTDGQLARNSGTRFCLV